ncbi:hypothetical protein [Streptomyces mirabilis]|uniref:hypothetical protein n=1 Tax=Streptomyces mirabilis TaxID=68239 RepID=UPI0036DF25F2
MLTEALAALAAAGGSAVVQAAGTDAWSGFRQRTARLLSRGDDQGEHAELERLDQTAIALEAANSDEAEGVLIRQTDFWQGRFRALLETSDPQERDQVAAQMRALLEQLSSTSGQVSAGPEGMAVGGSVDIRADGGSIAAGVIKGGAHIGPPSSPAPDQG